AEDGLALSSRNSYLSPEQRAAAPALYRELSAMADAIRHGQRDYAALIVAAQAQLLAAGFRPDYLEVRHALTLRPAMIDDRDVVVIAAAYLGTTRLIDNLYLHLDELTA
ncbi:MAG: pantoate--beta-alanine ligase, partial [Gammaproteobacteria bacterium]